MAKELGSEPMVYGLGLGVYGFQQEGFATSSKTLATAAEDYESDQGPAIPCCTISSRHPAYD